MILETAMLRLLLGALETRRIRYLGQSFRLKENVPTLGEKEVKQ